MILFLLCISLAKASISIPIHKRILHPKMCRVPLISVLILHLEDFLHHQAFQITKIFNTIFKLQLELLQTFTFLVDTRSSWTWIDSADCLDCHGGNKFYPDKSSTYKNSTQDMFLWGDIAYYLSTDTISIGGSSSLTITDQPFNIFYSETFTEMVADGSMGFGFEDINEGTSSLISALKSQGKIKNRQFAIYLSEQNRYSDLLNLGNSNLMIDGNDIEEYSIDKNFTYIDLISNDWEVPFNSMVFDGIYFWAETALIYTTVSGFVGPAYDIDKILTTLMRDYNCMPDYRGDIYCDCSKTYPTLTFMLSGHSFVITQSDYFKVHLGYCYPQFYQGLDRLHLEYWEIALLDVFMLTLIWIEKE